MAVKDAFGAQVPVFRKLRSDEGQALAGLVARAGGLAGGRVGRAERRALHPRRLGMDGPGDDGGGTPGGAQGLLAAPRARYEADGLRLWAGAGAVRVLRSDPRRWAILIERCIPGVALGDSALAAPARSRRRPTSSASCGPRRCRARTVRDLGRGGGGVAELVRECMRRHRPPFDAGLVALGARLLETLPAGGRSVVLHGTSIPATSCRRPGRPGSPSTPDR